MTGERVAKISVKTVVRISMLTLFVFALGMSVWAAVGGSISGTVTDQTGAVVPGTPVVARNLDTAVEETTTTNDQGFYAFPYVPVGRYEVEIVRQGFQPYKRTGLVIDVNTQLREDISIMVSEQTNEVVVSGNAVQVETQSTQLGDVITGSVMTAVGLNGRSYTDLLALQPGIVPFSTQTPDSV